MGVFRRLLAVWPGLSQGQKFIAVLGVFAVLWAFGIPKGSRAASADARPDQSSLSNIRLASSAFPVLRMPGEALHLGNSEEAQAMRELKEIRAKSKDKSVDPKANAGAWIKRYEDFISRHPASQAAGDARLSIAWRKHWVGDDDDANAEIDSVIHGYVGWVKAKAIATKGYYFQHTGRASEAIEFLQAGVKEFTGTHDGLVVKLSLAWTYAALDRPDLAQAQCAEIESDTAATPHVRAETMLHALLMRKHLLSKASYIDPGGNRVDMSFSETTALFKDIQRAFSAFSGSRRSGLLASVGALPGGLAAQGTEGFSDEATFELASMLFTYEAFEDAAIAFNSVMDSPTATYDMKCAATVGLAATLARQGNLNGCVSLAQSVVNDPDANIYNATAAASWQANALYRLGLIGKPRPDTPDNDPVPVAQDIPTIGRMVLQ